MVTGRRGGGALVTAMHPSISVSLLVPRVGLYLCLEHPEVHAGGELQRQTYLPGRGGHIYCTRLLCVVCRLTSHGYIIQYGWEPLAVWSSHVDTPRYKHTAGRSIATMLSCAWAGYCTTGINPTPTTCGQTLGARDSLGI